MHIHNYATMPKDYVDYIDSGTSDDVFLNRRDFCIKVRKEKNPFARTFLIMGCFKLKFIHFD